MDWLGSVVQALIEAVFHATAKALLPLCTFGWVRAEPFGSSRELSIRRAPDGTILIGVFWATIVGLLFWVFAGIAVAAMMAGREA